MGNVQKRNYKQGKDVENRTLCPCGNFSQAIMSCIDIVLIKHASMYLVAE